MATTTPGTGEALPLPTAHRPPLRTTAAVVLSSLRSARAQYLEEVVLNFYDAVQKHDWQTAYGYFGTNLQQEQSLDAFTQGFADTAFTFALVGRANDEGMVQVLVTAWLNDGTPQAFTGYYEVGDEGGQQKILCATISPSDASGIAPLCRAANLTVDLAANAGTGHRFGDLTATNSGATCTIAGLPTVTISSSGGEQLVSGTLAADTTIEAITLEKGDSALLQIDWSNWCGAPIDNSDIRVNVTLPGQTGRLTVDQGFGVPPCLGDPGSASQLSVRPWQST